MSDAIAIIYAVVRNVHLKRALHAAPGRNEKQNFWRMMMGNSMDMAVIDWCKLFGSDDEDHQPVHWKNQVSDAEHDKFRAGLLDAVGLSKDEWRDYWEKTKAYRNQHAAHFDATYLEDDPKYPDLTVALESAYFYYAWLKRNPDDQAKMRTHFQKFGEQAEAIAAAAYAATAGMSETID